MNCSLMSVDQRHRRLNKTRVLCSATRDPPTKQTKNKKPCKMQSLSGLFGPQLIVPRRPSSSTDTSSSEHDTAAAAAVAVTSTAVTSLFTQSRIIHRSLAKLSQDELNGPVVREAGHAIDHVAVAMLFIAPRFHEQVFDAIAANPLSAMLSLAWTICSTSMGVSAAMRDDEYAAIWSPFVCLANGLSAMQDLYSPATPSSTNTNTSSTTTTSSSSSSSSALNLFDYDDLRAADLAYIKYETNEQALLDGELFRELANQTPFGTYEIDSVPATLANAIPTAGFDAMRDPPEDEGWVIGGRRYRWVARPISVSDRKRYYAYMPRHAALSRLRLQAELGLRKKFARYHARRGLHLTPWLLASHPIVSTASTRRSDTNTASNSDDDDNSTEQPRLLIWQAQKSALVWLLYHTIAAFARLLNDRGLRDDVLVAVRSLDRFIDCGLCAHHWRTRHLAEYEAMTAGQDDLDLRLLQTHNRIRASIRPDTELTDAAVHALQQDYLNVARALAAACMLDDDKLARVSQLERKRGDVCREPYELWSAAMRTWHARHVDDPASRTGRDVVVAAAAAAEDRTPVKRALMLLQLDRLSSR